MDAQSIIPNGCYSLIKLGIAKDGSSNLSLIEFAPKGNGITTTLNAVLARVLKASSFLPTLLFCNNNDENTLFFNQFISYNSAKKEHKHLSGFIHKCVNKFCEKLATYFERVIDMFYLRNLFFIGNWKCP